ncbi:MAG: class I SAM-dependent methyltransferase [Planctomycetota bacterium]
MGGDWFVEAFRDRYLEVYPHRDLASARAEIDGLLAMRGPAEAWGRTLDLGAGFGRHTLALLERGVDVVGMDLSAELLARRTTLPGEELERRLVRGDMRRLPFRDACFDTIVCLFSSFGYFDEAGNRAVLDGLRRVLANRGRVLLDVMNSARIRTELVPRSVRAVGAGALTEERSLSADGSRVRKIVTLAAPDGAEERWHEDVQLFAPDALDELVAGAGYRTLARFGDFDSRPFDDAAPRQLVWLERA